MQESIALPDVHSGYGFAIGNVAAFDMSNPEAVVSPGGVGFDINCGVRLIRTNLVGIVSAALTCRYPARLLQGMGLLLGHPSTWMHTVVVLSCTSTAAAAGQAAA